MKSIFFLLLVTGCAAEQAATQCETVCDELVKQCSYEAFPSYDSCVQGCLYEEEQGSKTERASTCIQDAGCDTFKIIECEHAPGVDVE